MVKSVATSLGSIALVLFSSNHTFAVDCNSNGVDDTKDISGSTSQDVNTNGVPDECDLRIGLMFPGAVHPNINPPDPTLAVGFQHVVSTVNRRIRVSTKDGLVVTTTFLNDDGDPGFFEEVGAGEFVFDPRCLYDQYSNRFVVITLDRSFEQTRGRELYLAVSRTDDPTDLSTNGWYKCRTPANAVIDGMRFTADFPGLGVDERAIYVTFNLDETAIDQIADLLRSGFSTFGAAVLLN